MLKLRRFAAGVIDFVLVMVVFQAVALGAYALSDTRIRMASNFLHFNSSCHYNQLKEGPVAGTLVCAKTFFGADYNRTKRLDYRDGRSSNTFAVDSKDRPVTAFDISPLKGLALILALALYEAQLGTTPGKRLLGLRVTGADLTRATARNVMIWGGFALLHPINYADDWLSTFSPVVTFVLLGVALVLWIVPLIGLIFARSEPFYDRASGTRVVRG